MKKWNMVIDVALCHDCNNCFLADKDEFVGNEWPPYSAAQPWEGHRWMNVERKERGRFPHVRVAYLPVPCMHCDDAPCIKDSPPGTIHKRDDGLVLIDPEKAKGHPGIVDTCPYGAIYWNEERGVAQKCTGCAHLMDEEWTDTRCTQVCPTGALRLVFAEDEEMAASVRAERLEAYLPELKTAPRVYYKNLQRWTKAFVAGSVAFADTGECAEGARVLVSKPGTDPLEARTDNFGDFCVDGLEPGGSYSVAIEAPGYKAVQTTVTVDAKSVALSVTFLDRA